MAGSPTCGKISAGMRMTARMAQRAMATSATTTVMGRVRAARTSLTGTIALRRHECLRHKKSLGHLGEERADIAGGGGDSQEGAPYGKAGEGVVDFGLRQE